MLTALFIIGTFFGRSAPALAKTVMAPVVAASSPELFLEQVEKRKQLLSKASALSKTTTVQPKVHVYFLWTSWCEYCAEAYDSLQDVAKKFDPAVVQFVGVSLDTDVNEAVKAKAKAMSYIDEYIVPGKIHKEFPEFSRLPIMIVRGSEEKEIDVSTGFSSERMTHLKKSIERFLHKEESGDE